MLSLLTAQDYAMAIGNLRQVQLISLFCIFCLLFQLTQILSSHSSNFGTHSGSLRYQWSYLQFLSITSTIMNHDIQCRMSMIIDSLCLLLTMLILVDS